MNKLEKWTEEFIKDKVTELFVIFNILKPSSSDVDNAETFIRSLIGGVPEKKATVDKEFIKRWMDVLSWSAIPLKSGQIDISGDDLKQMLAEAGMEVKEKEDKKALIRGAGVTEEWIEEKAIELYNYLYYETLNLDQVRGFIRLLVGEMLE